MADPRPLRIKIFADGADLEGMLALAEDPLISGFTTNPTLMRGSGVTDYATFAKEVLAAVTEHPISFEVVADEFEEMRRQALLIASWGANVYVKIPVTNTRGESSADLIRELSLEGLKLNVTAILSLRQVWTVAHALTESRRCRGVRLRWPHCRHGPKPCAAHDGGARHLERRAPGGVALGQPTRDPQRDRSR